MGTKRSSTHKAPPSADEKYCGSNAIERLGMVKTSVSFYLLTLKMVVK